MDLEVDGVDLRLDEARGLHRVPDDLGVGPGELTGAGLGLLEDPSRLQDPGGRGAPEVVVRPGPGRERQVPALLEHAAGVPERGLGVLEQHVAPAAQDGVEARRRLVDRDAEVDLAEADVLDALALGLVVGPPRASRARSRW